MANNKPNTLFDIAKFLAINNIETTLSYDGQFYLNLNTGAKSHLHLYENGLLKGRYNHEANIDFNLPMSAIKDLLINEFNWALGSNNVAYDVWHKFAKLC